VARRCRDSSPCTVRSYRRVAALRRRIVHVRRRCLKNGLPIRVAPVPNLHFCRHARRLVNRMMVRRRLLLAQIPRCTDEDVSCVQRTMRKILRLNHVIAARVRRCKIALPNNVRRSLSHIVLAPVYSNVWRHAITCDGLRIKFKRWIRYQNARRIALHVESTECSPLDVSCLRFSFAQILHIHRRIRNARTRMAEKLRVCDECAPLKLAFRRWLRRQRARRARIHRSIARCRPSDVGCHHRRVARIAQIQQAIRDRRAAVVRMHNHCHQRGGTQGDFWATATSTTYPSRILATMPANPPTFLPQPVTFAPVVRSAFGGAAAVSTSVLLVALFAILAALF